MRRIREFWTSDTTATDSFCYQEGENGIESMWYHPAKFEGDKHYIDVKYDNGMEQRVFHIDEFVFWNTIKTK